MPISSAVEGSSLVALIACPVLVRFRKASMPIRTKTATPRVNKANQLMDNWFVSCQLLIPNEPIGKIRGSGEKIWSRRFSRAMERPNVAKRGARGPIRKLRSSTSRCITAPTSAIPGTTTSRVTKGFHPKESKMATDP